MRRAASPPFQDFTREIDYQDFDRWLLQRGFRGEEPRV